MLLFRQIKTLTLSVEHRSDKMVGFFLIICLVCGATFSTETSALREFSAGNLRFTKDIYEELIKSTENLVVSSLSAEIVLALTSEGAKGLTKEQLVKALYLPEEKETETAISGLALNISTETLKLLSANKIYVGKHFQIEATFKNLAEKVYRAGVENVDFVNSVSAANLINHWVEEHTNSRIKNLIDPSLISPSTRIVMVNALYFSGRWSHPFSKRNTHSETFYISPSTTKKVDMMHSGQTGTSCRFLHSEQLGAKFLEMGYQNSEVIMTIILPDAIDGLTQIERDLGSYLEQQDLTSEQVDIALPKFTITSSIDFKVILMKLGVQEIFRNSADLSGISKGDRLLVDHIVQKAFIDVSESGTEAAAATAVIGGLTAVLDPPRPKFNFIANHPFAFYLRDKNSGVILFVGRYVN